MKKPISYITVIRRKGKYFDLPPVVIVLTIFPTQDSKRSEYYIQAIPYLDANKVRLALDSTKLTALLALFASWIDVYPKAIDVNQSTKTLLTKKDKLIADITKALRDMYKDIPDSLLTEEDRNTLNLHERATASSRPVIADVPNVLVKAEKGSVEKLEFRKQADSSRPSIHPDADAIEIRFAVDKVVNSIADCDQSVIKSKATVRLRMPHDKAGKRFNGYARWVNLSDESKSGEFTPLFGGLISE